MWSVDTRDFPSGFDHLRGLRVLLVEDEPMICLLFEDMLVELGCELVGSASDFSKACDLADSQKRIDVAILDVNLCGRPVYPMASRLVERGVSLLFCTGFGADGLLPERRHHSTLGKPVTIDMLAHGLTHAVASSRARLRDLQAAEALLRRRGDGVPGVFLCLPRHPI
jgi:CheY-like chemotaxis protein